MTLVKRWISWLLASGLRLAVAAAIAILLVATTAVAGTAMHYSSPRSASPGLRHLASDSGKSAELQGQIVQMRKRLKRLESKVAVKREHARRLSHKAVELKRQLRRVRRHAEARYGAGL